MTQHDLFVEVTTTANVAEICLTRPEALNAINSAMARQLISRFESLGTDPRVRVVMIRGDGDRAFCAGADLKERAAFTTDDWKRQRELFRRMFAALRTLPQPTIAAVHGFALGGGMEIALVCDWIVAAVDAQFGLPEALLGIIPGGNGAINLPRLIGPNRAKELLFSGRRITADEAFALGIAQRVVSSEKLLEEARSTAWSFAAASPTSLRAIKRLANAALDVPNEDALLIEEQCYQSVISSNDRIEGISAFAARRPPHWSEIE